MIVVGQNFVFDALETRGDGLLHISYVLTQPGVYSYKLRDGRTVRALKAPEDWLGEKFLASARSVPVTIEHPEKLATPQTANDHVGLTDSTPAFVKDGKVYHGATLSRQDAIDLVRAKVMKGVSAGTHVVWQENSGVFRADDGTSYPYDIVQTSPVLNHTALTRAMRVKSATFVYDSDTAAIWVPNPDVEDAMDELKELLAKLALDSTANAALNKLVADRDAKIGEITRQNDELRGERDSLKAKLEQAPSLDSLDSRLAGEVKQLAAIAAKVPSLDVEKLASAKSTSERYRMALDSLKISVDANATEDYLRGRFEGAVSEIKPKTGNPHPNSAQAALMAQDSVPQPKTAEQRIAAAKELNARRSRGENV